MEADRENQSGVENQQGVGAEAPEENLTEKHLERIQKQETKVQKLLGEILLTEQQDIEAIQDAVNHKAELLEFFEHDIFIQEFLAQLEVIVFAHNDFLQALPPIPSPTEAPPNTSGAFSQKTNQQLAQTLDAFSQHSNLFQTHQTYGGFHKKSAANLSKMGASINPRGDKIQQKKTTLLKTYYKNKDKPSFKRALSAAKKTIKKNQLTLDKKARSSTDEVERLAIDQLFAQATKDLATQKPSELSKKFEFIEWITSGGDLGAVAIRPIQRIPRYRMLLEEIAERTPPEHSKQTQLGTVLDSIKEIATATNEHIRQVESNINVTTGDKQSILLENTGLADLTCLDNLRGIGYTYAHSKTPAGIKKANSFDIKVGNEKTAHFKVELLENGHVVITPKEKAWGKKNTPKQQRQREAIFRHIKAFTTQLLNPLVTNIDTKKVKISVTAAASRKEDNVTASYGIIAPQADLNAELVQREQASQPLLKSLDEIEATAKEMPKLSQAPANNPTTLQAPYISIANAYRQGLPARLAPLTANKEAQQDLLGKIATLSKASSDPGLKARCAALSNTLQAGIERIEALEEIIKQRSISLQAVTSNREAYATNLSRLQKITTTLNDLAPITDKNLTQADQLMQEAGEIKDKLQELQQTFDGMLGNEKEGYFLDNVGLSAFRDPEFAKQALEKFGSARATVYSSRADYLAREIQGIKATAVDSQLADLPLLAEHENLAEPYQTVKLAYEQHCASQEEKLTAQEAKIEQLETRLDLLKPEQRTSIDEKITVMQEDIVQQRAVMKENQGILEQLQGYQNKYQAAFQAAKTDNDPLIAMAGKNDYVGIDVGKIEGHLNQLENHVQSIDAAHKGCLEFVAQHQVFLGGLGITEETLNTAHQAYKSTRLAGDKRQRQAKVKIQGRKALDVDDVMITVGANKPTLGGEGEGSDIVSLGERYSTLLEAYTQYKTSTEEQLSAQEAELTAISDELDQLVSEDLSDDQVSQDLKQGIQPRIANSTSKIAEHRTTIQTESAFLTKVKANRAPYFQVLKHLQNDLAELEDLLQTPRKEREKNKTTVEGTEQTYQARIEALGRQITSNWSDLKGHQEAFKNLITNNAIMAKSFSILETDSAAKEIEDKLQNHHKAIQKHQRSYTKSHLGSYRARVLGLFLLTAEILGGTGLLLLSLGVVSAPFIPAVGALIAGISLPFALPAIALPIAVGVLIGVGLVGVGLIVRSFVTGRQKYMQEDVSTELEIVGGKLEAVELTNFAADSKQPGQDARLSDPRADAIQDASDELGSPVNDGDPKPDGRPVDTSSMGI